MIVLRKSSSSFRLIMQYDHAAHASQLIQNWQLPQSLDNQIWPRVISATFHHDDGWKEHNYTLDKNNQPYDFLTLPMKSHIQYFKRSVLLANNDLFQAALIAKHFYHVTCLMRACGCAQKDFPVCEEYLDWSSEYISQSLSQLLLNEPDHAACFQRAIILQLQRILTFVDQISVMMTGALPLHQFSVPLLMGDREDMLRYSIDGDCIKLDPWPFRCASFDVHLLARDINTTVIESPHHFQSLIDDAKPYLLHHKVQPY